MQVSKRDLHAAMGSVAFWTPSIVLHAVKGAEFSLQQPGGLADNAGLGSLAGAN